MDDMESIAAYARQLEEALRRAGRPLQPLVDEAIAHLLEDAARIARAEGCGDDGGGAARHRPLRRRRVGGAASRRNGRALAASVARIASLVLLAVLGWQLMVTLVDEGLSTPADLAVTLALVGELAVMTLVLLRALAGRTAPRLLSPLLALNGAVALALLVGYVTSAAIASKLNVLGIVLNTEPLVLVMFVQSAAGLRALGPPPQLRRHARRRLIFPTVARAAAD